MRGPPWREVATKVSLCGGQDYDGRTGSATSEGTTLLSPSEEISLESILRDYPAPHYNLDIIYPTRQSVEEELKRLVQDYDTKEEEGASRNFVIKQLSLQPKLFE